MLRACCVRAACCMPCCVLLLLHPGMPHARTTSPPPSPSPHTNTPTTRRRTHVHVCTRAHTRTNARMRTSTVVRAHTHTHIPQACPHLMCQCVQCAVGAARCGSTFWCMHALPPRPCTQKALCQINLRRCRRVCCRYQCGTAGDEDSCCGEARQTWRQRRLYPVQVTAGVLYAVPGNHQHAPQPQRQGQHGGRHAHTRHRVAVREARCVTQTCFACL